MKGMGFESWPPQKKKNIHTRFRFSVLLREKRRFSMQRNSMERWITSPWPCMIMFSLISLLSQSNLFMVHIRFEFKSEIFLQWFCVFVLSILCFKILFWFSIYLTNLCYNLSRETRFKLQLEKLLYFNLRNRCVRGSEHYL